MSQPADTHHNSQSEHRRLSAPWVSPPTSHQLLSVPRISKPRLSASPPPATEAARGSKRTRQDNDVDTPASGTEAPLPTVKEKGPSKKRRTVARDPLPPTSTSKKQNRPRKKLSSTAPGFPVPQQTPPAPSSSAQRVVSTPASVVSPLLDPHPPVRRRRIALPQVPPVPRLFDAPSPAVPAIVVTPDSPTATRQQRHRVRSRGTNGARAAAGRAQSHAPQPAYAPTYAAHTEATTQSALSTSLPLIPYSDLFVLQPANYSTYVQKTLEGVLGIALADFRGRESISGGLLTAMHARSSRSTFVVGPVNQESSGALRRASTFGPEIDEKLENIWSSTYSAEYRGVEDSPSASGRSGSSFSSSSSPFTPSASGSPATLEAADPAPVPSPEDPSRLVTVTSHPVELQFQPASAQQHPSQNAVENSPSPASSPSASSTTPPITQPAGCGNPASRPVTSPGIETNGHRAPSTELPQDEPPSLATHSGHDLRVWPWSEAECPSVLANDAIALGAEAPQSLYEEFSYGVLDTSGESMATFRGSPLRVVEDVEWDQLMMNQGGDGGSLGAEFEHDFSGGLGFIYPSSSSL